MNAFNELSHETTSNIVEKTFNFFKSLFRRETEALKEDIENSPDSKEVADVAFEDFKNSLFKKKTIDSNGKEKTFYSAQLLGTVNFFGETLLKPILENEYKGNTDILENITDKIKENAMDSLLNSGISAEEKSAFWADFEEYRQHVKGIQTNEDLQALKNGNLELTQQYEATVSEELEQEMDTKVTTERQHYIDEQKKLNTNWTEDALVIPGRIGTLPKSFPVKSAPYEKSSSGTTLCAKTAWNNAQNFGINLPSGNAYDAARKSPISSAFQKKVGSVDQPKQKISTDFSKLAPESNFADIYTTSKSQYGHRAIAFLNQSDHQRYVLDPYSNKQATTPILLADYQKKRGVIQANFYTSEYYVV
ncbi:MAG: hypothetical protein LBO09_01280 [Candidatus Peribacteria bacterium]|jgi:hypothetical protein|nr:hypothetical protein [Candidatus Peribacteria bacterium]